MPFPEKSFPARLRLYPTSATVVSIVEFLLTKDLTLAFAVGSTNDLCSNFQQYLGLQIIGTGIAENRFVSDMNLSRFRIGRIPFTVRIRCYRAVVGQTFLIDNSLQIHGKYILDKQR